MKKASNLEISFLQQAVKSLYLFIRKTENCRNIPPELDLGLFYPVSTRLRQDTGIIFPVTDG